MGTYYLLIFAVGCTAGALVFLKLVADEISAARMPWRSTPELEPSEPEDEHGKRNAAKDPPQRVD